jgi:putative ABC transport system permease protein
MIQHYIKVVFRNFYRYPLYAGINLVSLTVGMAATLLIGLWVQNELRFDQYHKRADQIWRVTTDLRINPTDYWHWSSSPLKLAELAAQVPGVEQTAQVKMVPEIELTLWKGPQYFSSKCPMWVSETWFKTFDYKLKEGSLDLFFEKPTQMLLSESKAREIFGNHAAVGQTLRMDTLYYTVCGVLADPSPQSSYQHEVVMPISQGLMIASERKSAESWSNFNYSAFVELHPSADPKAVATQLTELLHTAKGDSNIVLGLQPLSEIHFDTVYQDDLRKGSRSTVHIFALIGLLLLAMACVNYVSLTTARASARASEIGIKKVNGARNGHIFGQIFAESAVLAVSAAALALLLVNLSMPVFNQLTEQNFHFDLQSGFLRYLLGGTLAATLLLAGLYPAWLLSRFQPMSIIRNKGGSAAGRSSFRQGLVVMQFVISAALLACTVVIWQQRQYIQNKPLGYDRGEVFTFRMGWQVWRDIGFERAGVVRDAMRQALQNTSSVAQVSIGSDSPVNLQSTHSGSVKFDGLAEDAAPTVSQLSVDAQFADMFRLEMLEGRWFSADSEADKSNVVLNETAARELGLRQPWVGQRFGFHGAEGQVIGVLRDFHFQSLHNKITPLVIQMDDAFQFFVKPQPGSTQKAVAAAEQLWKANFPDAPFRYKTLDDTFDQLYGNEQKASLLFQIFTVLAIFISCLGLFGLSVFAVERRTKEIGIRKVLGASVAGITGLLARDYLKLVLIAIVIASPVAFYFMQKWLSDFAYRIDLQWWMFAGAGVMAIVIALLTVGFQSVRAALANPVKSLRSE